MAGEIVPKQAKSQLKLNDAPNGAPLFNPTRLSTARRRRGLTKTELAEKLGVDIRTVVAYDSGEYPPGADILAKLTIVTGFTAAFFFGEDIDEPTVESASFRALTKMKAKDRDMALSQGAIAFHFTDWLERSFELPEASIPNLERQPSPEAAADAVRAAWGIGHLPIRNLIHLLEAKGVRIFSLSIDAREVDAFSIWRGDTPYILLNQCKSSEHSRYDAAHELGHLVLHRHGSPQGKVAELEADVFASAFLMPRASVLSHAPKFATVLELARIKKIWGVSLAAMNHRLHDLGVISDWLYRRLCVEIAQKGYRTAEPNSIARESSLILPKLLYSLYRDDGRSRTDIATELGISPNDLEALLFSLVMGSVNGGRPNDSAKAGVNIANLKRIK